MRIKYINKMNQEDYAKFSINKIFRDETGKKVYQYLPKGWQSYGKKEICDNKEAYTAKHHRQNARCCGVPTGKANNIIVVDFDHINQEQFNQLLDVIDPEATISTPCVKTPNGFHIYFKYCEEHKALKNETKLGPDKNIDIRTTKGFVVGAGSETEGGGKYEWITSPDDADYQLLTDSILEKIYRPKYEDNWNTHIYPPVLPVDVAYDRSDIVLSDFDDKELKMHLENINASYFRDGYDTWRNIGWAVLSSFKDKDAGWKLFDELSEKYDPVSHAKGIEHVREHFKEGRFTAGTIKYYSRESNAKNYFKINMKFKPRMWGNELEAAEDWLDLRQDTLTLNKTNMYLYEKNEWEVEEPDHSIIRRHLARDLLAFYGELCKSQHARVNELEADENVEKADRDAAEALWMNYVKKTNQIGNYNCLNNIYKSVKYILENQPELEFDEADIQNDYLHYKNGKLNLFTGEFSKRTIEDFIAHRINYNYVDAVSDEAMEAVKLIFKKFEPVEHLHKFIMQWIFYSLTGYTHEQKFVHFYGPMAENGKSTFMRILRICFPNYVAQIDNRVLCKAEQQRDKTIEAMAANRALRLAYTEELGSSSIDEGFVKEFVDAEPLEYKKMYGTKQIYRNKAKLTNCSNFELSADKDEGIIRRAIIYECKSKFIDKNSVYASDINWNGEDDWDNRVFKKDPQLTKKFEENDEYKIAVIKYIMEYRNKKLDTPEELITATKESFINNDDWLSTILEYFVITKKKDDMISKTDVHEILEDLYGESKSKQAFNKRLKTYGIIYQGSKRCKTTDGHDEQGAYLGIKPKDFDSDESDEE